MPIVREAALAHISSSEDAWWRWRAARLLGEAAGEPIPRDQDELGGFIGPTGRPSPGATGEGLCHLAILGLRDSAAVAIATDWLKEMRTPAGAWLDRPEEVPGVLDDTGGARVWATAAAATGLKVMGDDPGERCFLLLRADTDQRGAFTGGAYPTFAGAAALWLAEGPRTETAEWALRWAREDDGEWWGPWERATALTFWAAAGIGLDHLTVEYFVETLREEAPETGWPDDPGLTLRTLEVFDHLGAGD